MKKKLCVFLWVLICFSCQKDPDTSKLDNDFPVLTDHDSSTNFSNYTSYYVADSVLLIGTSQTAKYWTGSDAMTLVNAFVNNMNSQGFTRVDNKTDADLGLQVSYIEDVNYFYGYDNSYWWWDYPGYWGPGYWGGGWYDWGWYYPYPVVYYYNVGSLLAELVDLNNPVTSNTQSRLSVLWTAYMTGLLSSSDNVNVQLSVRAINQAFEQSTYLKK